MSGKIISWTAAAAVFLMIFWVGFPARPADVLFSAIGILIFFSKDVRRSLKEMWPKLRPYGLSFALIVFFIAAAQAISYGRGYNAIDAGVIKNYARLIFNSYIFLLSLFLVAHNRKSLRPMSVALLVSPVLIVPALWGGEEKIFLAGGRLTGFMQTPIIFGLWIAVVYLIGLGLFLDARKKIVQLSLLIWLAVIASFILWAASRASWLALGSAAALWILYLLFQEKTARGAARIAAVLMVTFSLGLLALPKTKTLDARNFVLGRALENTAALLQRKPIPAQSHFKVWPIVAAEILKNPAGFGFGDYIANHLGKIKESEDSNIPNSANNTFLEILLYGGAGAFLVFISLLGRLGADIKKTLTTLPRGGLPALNFAWLLAAAAVLIDVFFTDGFLLRHVWFVLGVAAGAALSMQGSVSRGR